MLIIGITFAAAGIVKLFMSAAKRLKWNQKTANGLGNIIELTSIEKKCYGNWFELPFT